VELFLDTETYNATPIKRGAYRYAQDCEVMLVSYAIDDGPVQLWDVTTGAVMPLDLAKAIDSQCRIIAHNAMFDRTVLGELGYGLYNIFVPRWWCTMSQAMAHSLPGKLADLCALFNLKDEHAKHDGKDYIALFCKPRPKNSKIPRYTRETHPVEWEGFKTYAMQDIASMRELYRNKLPRWNYGADTETGRRELALWHLDQVINDRGVHVDLDFSNAAVRAMDQLKVDMDADTDAATEGEVSSTTKRDQLLKHLLAAYGVSLPDLRASTVERRLEDPDLPEPVKELLALRLEASMTAGKKHKAVLGSVCDDGRLHGLLRFCGAGRTGRWSGQIFQPQNLVRPPKYLKGDAYDVAISDIKRGQIDTFDKPMEVISGTVRGVLIPTPGKRYAVADLSNIEGRMLAWLAGEEWKLAAYASGADLYKLTYGRTFGTDPEAIDDDSPERQIGKVEELALGYQGAVGAFAQMAAGYGVDLPEAEVVKIVKGWRKANSRISSFWYEAEDAVRQAINNPGTWIECRRVRIIRKGAWLRCVLPSGRSLCYPRPRITEDGKIAYDGFNQYTRKWGEIKTYGGKLVENWTQAASRDIMGWNMPLIEESGFELVLSVHDELITEVPAASPLNGEILAALMVSDIPWAEGLPLAAVGKDLDRYRKA
jgi:DNA polymerase